MPRPGEKIEKAKDFKGSILRLFKELNKFKVLIYISFILAVLGSILSIIAPDRLSSLTDAITDGLKPNSENLEQLKEVLESSFKEDEIQKIMPELIKVDLSEENIIRIMSSSEISEEDKNSFISFISNASDYSALFILPDSIKKELFIDNTYNGVTISAQDQISLLSSQETKELPDSIMLALLNDVEIDNKKISRKDLLKTLKLFSNMNEDVNELYSKMDKLPKSVANLIKPKMDLNKIKQIALLLVIIYVLSALFTYIEAILMANVSNRFAKDLRKKISHKINKLPLSYFDKHTIGNTLSRVTNDVDTISQTMNQSMAPFVAAITLFLGSIIMMFITNWVMALTAIISSFIGFIFMFIILGKSQKYFVQKQNELGTLNGHIEEVYSGLSVIKAYNASQEKSIEFDEYNNKLYTANRKSQFLSSLMMPLMVFIGNFGYVAVCVVGALLASNGYITFGVIVAFIIYVRLFTQPLSQIGQAMTTMQSAAAASERVFEFLDEEEMIEEKDKKYLDKSKAKGNIEFKNVEFTYDGNNKPTIYDFTASIKQGAKVAIVGPTGAGKTTMVNLLMKFYNISDGDILIDGVSIHDLTRENIHDLFTMVLQDTWVFNGTVKENIIYNQENVSLEEVKKACEAVGLDHYIKSLPKGYDSIIGDNDTISSGERQLLTIARGMLEKCPFLILDEATSNVDTRTEELVQKAMDKLMQGKTSFIIAHRLSTIKNADLILVMKDGNIIESGNHNELIDKNGFYAELYNSQFSH